MAEVIFEGKEKLEEEFLQFLRELNFPSDSFFRGPSFQPHELGRWKRYLPRWLGKAFRAGRDADPRACYADLALLDLENKDYIALIEFRPKLDEQAEAQLTDFFQAILAGLETKPPVFLAVPLPNSGFRIYQFHEHAVWQELPRRGLGFPRYETLAAGHAAAKAVAREAKQRRALERFTIICYALATAVALCAIASLSGLAALTPTEAFFLLMAALLIIAPHSVGFRVSGPGPKGRPHPVEVRKP